MQWLHQTQMPMGTQPVQSLGLQPIRGLKTCSLCASQQGKITFTGMHAHCMSVLISCTRLRYYDQACHPPVCHDGALIT